jgi:hypothetical protein
MSLAQAREEALDENTDNPACIAPPGGGMCGLYSVRCLWSVLRISLRGVVG